LTGAANGIGRATALAFAREGASVVVADVSEKGNEETARMIQDLGGHVLAVTCEVRRNEDVQWALSATIETFGPLDFAFNKCSVQQMQASNTPSSLRQMLQKRSGTELLTLTSAASFYA